VCSRLLHACHPGGVVAIQTGPSNEGVFQKLRVKYERKKCSEISRFDESRKSFIRNRPVVRKKKEEKEKKIFKVDL